VPVVYLVCTLALPLHGPEPGFINRLIIGIFLGVLCFLLTVCKICWEMCLRQQFIQSRMKKMEMADDNDACKDRVDKESMWNEDMEHHASQNAECLPPGCVCQDVPALGDTCSVQDALFGERDMLHVQLIACHYVSKLNLAVMVGTHLQPASSLCYSTMTFEDFGDSWGDEQDERGHSRAETASIETLELRLLVCRFVGNVGIKAIQLACIRAVAELKSKHWKNTRAVIESMSAAENVQKPHRMRESSQKKLSLLRPCKDQEMHGVDSQISSSCTCCSGYACTSHHNHQDREKDFLDVSPQKCSASTVNEVQRRPSPTSSSSSSSSHSSSSGKGQYELIPYCHPDLAQFAGTWVCCNATEKTAGWLYALDISGNLVVDATGDKLVLKRDMHGNTALEGGMLLRHGSHLSRAGRKGGTLIYRKAKGGGE